MAVANLKKMVLFTRAHDEQRVLDLLQMSGVVHLTPGDVFLPDEDRPFFDRPATGADDPDEAAALEKRLLTLQTAIDDLEPYEPHQGLAAHLAHPLECTTVQDFYTLEDLDEAPVVDQLHELAAREQTLHEQLRHLHDRAAPLEPLRDVPAPLEAFCDTARCFVEIVTLPRPHGDDLKTNLEDLLGEEGVLFELAAARDHTVVCAAGRLEAKRDFEEWIDAQPAERIDVGGLEGTAAENLERLRCEQEALEQKLAEVEVKRQALAGYLPKLKQVYDYRHTRLDQLEKKSLVRESRYTALISGWIRDRDVEQLETLFTKHDLDAYLLVKDPDPEDNPPVEYDNPPLVQPFEFVSDLYSRPQYFHVDPTPYVGAFFTVFFALCLTDAGYGLILAIGAYLALRKLPSLAASSRKLIKILFFAGLGTTVVGLLTGGFFGLSLASLPGPFKHLEKLVVLNPMTNQMEFLLITLAFGVVQVAFGIFLKFRWNLQRRHKAEAWLDQAPWLGIILGVVLLVAASSFNAPWLSTLGYGMMILSGGVILLFAGRASKNPAGRLASGLFSLYQVSGMFGDVLSYVRLFALGLATGVIASVVNFMAELTLGIPYVGFVVMLVVLVFGHLLNIAINALGGFIHTTRLQFVEFFGKFHEGGGAAFDAFQLNTKYTKVLNPR